MLVNLVGMRQLQPMTGVVQHHNVQIRYPPLKPLGQTWDQKWIAFAPQDARWALNLPRRRPAVACCSAIVVQRGRQCAG